MRLIVGLGNPGEKYARNRHNTGFILIDKLLEEKGLECKSDSKFNVLAVKDGDMLYAKPQTFMNNSGECVSKLVNFYKIDLNDLVVIHDDVDLELGKVKKQLGSSSAGHKGVESVLTSLGSKDFWRIRVGIGRPACRQAGPKGDDIEAWVLSDFSPSELEEVKNTPVSIG
jgi:PTH1 family peptidyl-tRNA hydrolase